MTLLMMLFFGYGFYLLFTEPEWWADYSKRIETAAKPPQD